VYVFFYGGGRQRGWMYQEERAADLIVVSTERIGENEREDPLGFIKFFRTVHTPTFL
jgi:hypothetical protein